MQPAANNEQNAVAAAPQPLQPYVRTALSGAIHPPTGPGVLAPASCECTWLRLHVAAAWLAWPNESARCQLPRCAPTCCVSQDEWLASRAAQSQLQ